MKNMPEYLTLEEVDGLLFQEPNFYHDLMGLGESITKLARVPFSLHIKSYKEILMLYLLQKNLFQQMI